MSRLSQAQYAFLVEPIKPARVQHLRGNSHLEQWDIRRHLIRAFGFCGYDLETKSVECVSQILHTVDKDGKPIPEHKPRWSVVYRAEVRLTVKSESGQVLAVYEDGATGDSQNQPSLGDAHDQALKTALSQALKRCAVNLGDQFGLSLYNGGRTDPVVHRSLVAPTGSAAPAASTQDDAVLPETAVDPQDDQVTFDALVDQLGKAKTSAEIKEVGDTATVAVRKGEMTRTAWDRLNGLAAERLVEIGAST